MADLDPGVRRNVVHIQDCRVWAEIFYLDSPTDYREHLAQSTLQLRESCSDLVMLEDSKRPPKVNALTRRLLVAGIVLVLSSGYLLYSILDLF